MAPAVEGKTCINWKKCFPRFLLKESIVARPHSMYRRWMVIPFTVANQICVGAVYAFSILNDPLCRQYGVVVPASQDWSVAQIVPLFSIFFSLLGVAAAFGGPILEDIGPRAMGTVAAILWGGCWICGAGTLKFHSLTLLYLQGLFGGIGLGLAYVTPVSNLLRWYSDRRGLAGAFSIMGTGAGALIFSPMMQSMLDAYFVPPHYLGPVSQVNVTTDGDSGQRYALVNNRSEQVVIASARDLSKLNAKLSPGVYVVGTGSVGVDLVFLNLGLVFMFVQLLCAFAFRVPPDDWNPRKLDAGVPSTSEPQIPEDDRPSSTGLKAVVCCSLKSLPQSESVHMNQALKTVQFYLLFGVLFLNITSGIGIIAIAKTIMTDVFGTQIPSVVNNNFAAGYVAAISVANLLGRFVWSTSSDYVGRKRTFAFFFLCGGFLYLTVPIALRNVTADSSNTSPLYWYLFATLLNFSFYGGGFSTITAYISDLFGTMHVGAIHGRLLLAWALAGIVGPMALAELRDYSLHQAVYSLANQMDPQVFLRVFGQTRDELDQLVSSKVVTLSLLMQYNPGTRDPTPTIYTSGFNFCGAMLCIGFVINMFVTTPSEKHWESFNKAAAINDVEDPSTQTTKQVEDENENFAVLRS